MKIIISDNNWLNTVTYSLSMKTGTLVFAFRSKIIVLSLRWNNHLHQSKYTITWSDELPPYDNITAIQCLPITNEVDEVKLITFTKFFWKQIKSNKYFLGSRWYSYWIYFGKMSADNDARQSNLITAMVRGTSAKHSITKRKEIHRRNLCDVQIMCVHSAK